MARILIVTMDGCGPDLDYGIYRMKEEKLDVTVAALKKKRLHVVLHQRRRHPD